MAIPQRSPNHKPSGFYHKKFDAAFHDGFFEYVGNKRHNEFHYSRYHYYLPQQVIPKIRFLKKYFYHLDDKSIGNIYRYRQTQFELFDTAVSVLFRLQNQILSTGEVILGSEYIRPIAWAVIGYNKSNIFCEHNFTCMTALFSYYKQMLGQRSYSVINVDRPYHGDVDPLFDFCSDPLAIMSNTYNFSVNFTLAVSLMFLADLVKHTGPDGGFCDMVYTNDKRSALASIDNWKIARGRVLSNNTLNVNQIYQKYWSVNNRPKTKKYFQVSIDDFYAGNQLSYGETINYVKETMLALPAPKPKVDFDPAFNYSTIDDIELMDLSDDIDENLSKHAKESKEMDDELKRILANDDIDYTFCC